MGQTALTGLGLVFATRRGGSSTTTAMPMPPLALVGLAIGIVLLGALGGCAFGITPPAPAAFGETTRTQQLILF